MQQDLDALKQGKPLTYATKDIQIGTEQRKDGKVNSRFQAKPLFKAIVRVPQSTPTPPAPSEETSLTPVPKVEKARKEVIVAASAQGHQEDSHEQIIITPDVTPAPFFPPKEQKRKSLSFLKFWLSKTPKNLSVDSAAQETRKTQAENKEEERFLSARADSLYKEAKTLFTKRMYGEAAERIREISNIKTLNFKTKILNWRIERRLAKPEPPIEKKLTPPPPFPKKEPIIAEKPYQKQVYPPPALPISPEPPSKPPVFPPSAPKEELSPDIQTPPRPNPVLGKQISIPPDVFENTTEQKKPARKISTKKIVVIGGSIALVLIIAAIGVIWFGQSPPPSPPTSTLTPPTPLLIGDESITVDLSQKKDLLEEISNLFSKDYPQGKLYNVFVKTDAPEKKYIANLSEIASRMNLKIPKAVTDKLDSRFALMLYVQKEISTSPFIAGYGRNRLILITSIKEPVDNDALSQTLANWQPTIVEDIKNLSYGRILNQANRSFTHTERNGAKISYINMPHPSLSVDYLITAGYLAFTNSKESTDAVIKLASPLKDRQNE